MQTEHTVKSKHTESEQCLGWFHLAKENYCAQVEKDTAGCPNMTHALYF